ncbi:MAG: hypothetical protein IIV74_01670, partial [Alphaproteobacteria bacterium]|nr:hypothetical protein [Alphaproteobacteria bacterium]
KQNVINAENMLSSEYVSGLADVAMTGSYESLTDKPTIPSTENLVTKDELNDLQNALQAKINEMHESGDYATAESLLAVSESLATLKGDVYTKAQVDKMIADVISGGQINLEGYAKQADLNTLSGIVDAIKLKTDVLGALAYKDTVATTDIDAKAVTTAQIAGGNPAEGDSMMLMSTNKDGTVTWTSVKIY